MVFKDYYKILGFEDNRVNQEQIKIAYREQAKKYHPDVNGVNRNTEERFKDINEAYRTLSNETTRRRYDRAWKTNIGRRKNREKYGKKEKTESLKDNIINILFGGEISNKSEKENKKDNIVTKGEDIETEIEISLEEAFYGKTKKISLRTVKGNLKTFTVKIPAGIRDGERIRLVGQGKKSKKDKRAGDLFIKVKVLKNDRFILKGYDLYTNIPIAPWEAALGTDIQVQGIDNTETIKIENGTSTGEKIVIEGKGFKDGKGRRGNLICIIHIVIGKEMSKKEEELYNELMRISEFKPRK